MADGGTNFPGEPPVQRRSGVVRRSDLPRPHQSTARSDWLALMLAGTLMVIVLVMVANVFTFKPISIPSSSPSLVAAVPTPTLKPTYSAEPTASPTLAPTPTPSPLPTLAPTFPPTLPPTLPPTATPSWGPTLPPTIAPTAPPSPPQTGLVILDPTDGSTATDRAITVRGIAQPGAPITQDITLWPDNHTTADSSGQWSFIETLNPGWNMFKFRIGDDFDTAVTINVYFGG